MKRTILLLLALIAGFSLALVDRAAAQAFTTLHSFSAVHYNGTVDTETNSDGAYPGGDLLLVGNTLFGPAYNGGSSGNGTVFRVNTDGTGFTNLHNFTATPGLRHLNDDGAHPIPGLISAGNTLYGTAYFGGRSGNGAVFRVNTDGAGFTNLHSFTATLNRVNNDGAIPWAGLILSGKTLYGTAQGGGRSGNGTVFKLNTDGTGFTNLHSFIAMSTNLSGVLTNGDGAYPSAPLLLSGDILYGTAFGGGSSGNGTVFALSTNGTGFTTLYNFTAGFGTEPDVTNSDGAFPVAGLILSGNALYGTAVHGGSSGNGTVFALNTDGTGFTNLHTFTALSGPPPGTNSDGAGPQGRLLLSGNTLYGTAVTGGGSGAGAVFQVNTDGSGFTSLYSFTPTITSFPYAAPFAGLVLSGNTLHGTERYGGSSGVGAVFSLSLPRPQLAIIPSGPDVILMWPTNAVGFNLQSAPAITGMFTNLSGATSPHTNCIAGAQQFFRLISN